MNDLATAAGLLALSLVTHLVLWRIRLPKRQTRALLLLFIVVPIVAAIVAIAVDHPLALSVPQTLRIALLYVACMLGYVVCYSLVENQSPTLAIVDYLAVAGKAGRSEADILARFGGGTTIEQRVELMAAGGWVHVHGDDIVLTPEGRKYALLFERGARIFGIELTGG
jgi:hypothetical protein